MKQLRIFVGGKQIGTIEAGQGGPDLVSGTAIKLLQIAMGDILDIDYKEVDVHEINVYEPNADEQDMLDRENSEPEPEYRYYRLDGLAYRCRVDGLATDYLGNGEWKKSIIFKNETSLLEAGARPAEEPL